MGYSRLELLRPPSSIYMLSLSRTLGLRGRWGEGIMEKVMLVVTVQVMSSILPDI